MAVTCHNLTVEYSSGGYVVRPVDGFELHADEGDMALLLGASGCGKTTVLSVLAAILRPSGGSVEVEGVEVTGLEGRGLTDKGDPGDRIYVVEQGEVEIFRVRDDASEELLTRITAGEYFGELAPMLGLRRSASARAAVPSRVLGMGPTEFRGRFGGSKLSELLGPGS